MSWSWSCVNWINLKHKTKCLDVNVQVPVHFFFHVYSEIWDKGILKFNKFLMSQVKKNNNVIL